MQVPRAAVRWLSALRVVDAVRIVWRASNWNVRHGHGRVKETIAEQRIDNQLDLPHSRAPGDEVPPDLLNMTFNASWAAGRLPRLRQVHPALLGIRWPLKRPSGSHPLAGNGWPDFVSPSATTTTLV